MKYIYSFLLLLMLPGLTFSQAITNYDLSDDGNNVLRVSSLFDSNGAGPVVQDNSTISLFIPVGLTDPSVTDVQGGSWSITANIPNSTLDGACSGLANGYYLLQISTGGQANLGAVTMNVAEDLFTISFAGTSADPVYGFDPTLVDPLSVCVGAFGVNNTATIDPDGNGGASPAVGYGDVVVTPGGLPLPVELLNFTASPLNGKDGKLNWRTATEENASHFIIERSPNGRDWEDAGKVAAVGTSVEIQSYDYLDKDVFDLRDNKEATFYYRLRIVDLDDSYEYSNIETIGFSGKQNNLMVDLYPNPVSRDQFNVNVAIFSDSPNKIQLRLMDALGRLVSTEILDLDRGDNNFQVQMNDLSAGVYFVRIGEGAESFVKKLIVQ